MEPFSIEKAAFELSQCLKKQKIWPKVDYDVAVIIYDWLQTCSDSSLDAVQSTIVAQLKQQIDKQNKRIVYLEELLFEKTQLVNNLEDKLKINMKFKYPSEQSRTELLPLIKRFDESNRIFDLIKADHSNDEIDNNNSWLTTTTGNNEPENQTESKFDVSVTQWDTETVCDWMRKLCLRDEHVSRMKLLNMTGRRLLDMSPNDFEKEFNFKNLFDRKKFFYTLQSLKSTHDLCLRKTLELDTNWALRWLDDIGLPQYKKQFSSNSIDGCLVHLLTFDDLAQLGIVSALHLASLQASIRVLRQHVFDPNVFKRRSLPTDAEMPSADEISLWTTHRVMDWLRSIDLAEFASNLRGSGVHGALLVHEPRFNDNLLARILTISDDKTLLRRHLATHFNRLLGPEIIAGKREAELNLMTLTLAGKIKVCKKSQFSLKRKKRQYDFVDNLICPIDKTTSTDNLTDH